MLIEAHVAAVFYYARLLAGNGFDCISEYLSVVKPDVHYYRAFGKGNYIGGVQSSPESDLENDDVAALLPEPQKCCSSHHLELCRMILHFFGFRLYPGDYVREDLVRDLLSVYLHPLVEAVEIG